MNKTMIIGHRGASAYAPQNTESAFRLAAALNADGVETDVHLTIDNELVIHHNYFIDETSDGEGALELMTLAGLKERDFGSYYGNEFVNQRILTLREFLEVVKDLEVINIELKSPIRKDFDFAGAVLECVIENGLLDKVIFSSFDVELIMAIKKKCINARVGLLTMFEKADMLVKEMTATIVSAYAIDNYQEIINKAGVCKDIIQLINSLEYKPDFWHPDFRSVLVNPNIVLEMNKLGIGVNPYTVDDKEQIRALIIAGCTGIITNKPDVALEVYNGII